MAISEAFSNIAANYRFHGRVRGGLAGRWFYLSLYYFIFIVFRWGDRHARALNWLRRSGLSARGVMVETPEGLRLTMDLHAAFDPLFSIVGERHYERRPEFRPAPGWCVMDVGANVGIFTAVAARLVQAGGRVIAVEPCPENLRRLEENVRLNRLENVTIVSAAADEREAEGRLYIHEFAINHSLVRPSGKSIPVAVKTLDRIAEECGLSRLDLIKLDTEGNVPAILRGARQLLRKHRPRLVFERDTEGESLGLRELFDELGYRSEDISVFTYAWPASS